MARPALLSELWRLALVDELTGLHNRRGFVGLADQLLEVASRNGLGATLMYMDIDSLKPINDAYGHHRGDDAFLAVAYRLRRTFRSSDVVARIGGDEFCALLVSDGSLGSTPVRRLLEAPLALPADGGPSPQRLPQRGVAHRGPDDDMGVEQMMEQADQAMVEAIRIAAGD